MIESNPTPRRFPLTALAIFLLSGAILLFELVLVRLFSFMTWHHYAFVVISIALLGFAASGVALSVWPALGQPPRRRAALYSGLFALTTVASVATMTRLKLKLGPELVPTPWELLSLLLNYLVLVVPFVFAGLAVVTLLSGFTRRVGALYGCDLLGAGTGCAAAVALTPMVGGEGMVVVAAALATVAAVLLALPDRRTVMAWGIVAVVLVTAAGSATHWLAVPPGPNKTLELRLRNPEKGARIVLTRWSALFRTDVVAAGASQVPWTQNPFVYRPQPPQDLIIIDGDAGTPIFHLDPGELRASGKPLDFLNYMLPTLPHQALRPSRVLVIGAGGGVDVLAALHHGAQRVDAVELNPDIVEIDTELFGEVNGGLFHRADVALHLDEGRSFISRSSERYDLIQLSLVDTWAASAVGAYCLVEGYLYTVEAFRDYLEHLTENGALTVSRWLKVPPRETLRLVTVADQALTELGVEEPGRHIVVSANGRIANVVVKRTPFTDVELTAMRRVAEERLFMILHPPGPAAAVDAGAVDAGAKLENASPGNFVEYRKSLSRGLTEDLLGPSATDNIFTTYLASPNRAAFHDAYPYDVRPVRDEWPFFFEFGRWSSIFSEASGRLILLAVIAQALVLSLVLLVLPLWLSRHRHRVPWRQTRASVTYFLLIGVAFMLLEVALIQRLTLFLGHPLYGLSLVLVVLLVGAGLGSLSAAPLIAADSRRTGALFAAILAGAVLYAVALPILFRAGLAWPLTSRLLASTALVLPLGFILGMPFPTAMARLEGSHLVGWAWAANGVGSVLGPLLAMLLAMDFGYGDVMLIAAALYGVAFLALARTRPSDSVPA